MPAWPCRILLTWVRTQVSAAGSPAGWKHHAAFHTYSITWIRSMTMVTVTLCRRASARMRSIWWVLPSTSATQVRRCCGSRRVASANPSAMTVAASWVIEAVSHFPAATGCGRRSRGSVGRSGRTSVTVRDTGAAS
jgi:hypothetical protein